jgi:hypothetical protein
VKAADVMPGTLECEPDNRCTVLENRAAVHLHRPFEFGALEQRYVTAAIDVQQVLVENVRSIRASMINKANGMSHRLSAAL